MLDSGYLSITLKSILPIIAVTLILMAIICIAWGIVRAVRKFFANPFHYPYFIKQFNVSGRRNVDIQNCIDRFLCTGLNRRSLHVHRQKIQSWKAARERYLETCHFYNLRHRQYIEVIDDARAYRFQTVRDQTRYRQQDYVKTPYTVTVVDEEVAVDWAWLSQRNEELATIDYEATLKDYHAKNQRRLMTPALRRQIMERDNYTCQICGKHMPDEVGLHIDHIVPVAKGGKTVPSNLQVLCSKCNGGKGTKLTDEHKDDSRRVTKTIIDESCVTTEDSC